MVTAHGLPGFVAYGVYLGEVAAPILLLTGLWVRGAALLAAFNMVVAVALVHSAQVFTLGKSGGWAIELQAFYFVTALVVALQADRSGVCYKSKTA
jgi:putative oxidoreductase